MKTESRKKKVAAKPATPRLKSAAMRSAAAGKFMNEKDEIKRFSKVASEYLAKYSGSEKRSLAKLQSLGITTATGRLTKDYK